MKIPGSIISKYLNPLSLLKELWQNWRSFRRLEKWIEQEIDALGMEEFIRRYPNLYEQ